MPQEKYAYNQRKKIKNSYRNHKITRKQKNKEIIKNIEIKKYTQNTQKNTIYTYIHRSWDAYIYTIWDAYIPLNSGRVYTHQFGTRIYTPIRDAYTHILHGLYLNK